MKFLIQSFHKIGLALVTLAFVLKYTASITDMHWLYIGLNIVGAVMIIVDTLYTWKRHHPLKAVLWLLFAAGVMLFLVFKL